MSLENGSKYDFKKIRSSSMQCWHTTHDTQHTIHDTCPYFSAPTNYESFAFSYRLNIYFYFYFHVFLISFYFKIVDHHYRWPTLALIQIFNQFQCSKRWTNNDIQIIQCSMIVKKVHKMCQRWEKKSSKKAKLAHYTNFEIRNDMH